MPSNGFLFLQISDQNLRIVTLVRLYFGKIDLGRIMWALVRTRLVPLRGIFSWKLMKVKNEKEEMLAIEIFSSNCNTLQGFNPKTQNCRSKLVLNFWKHQFLKQKAKIDIWRTVYGSKLLIDHFMKGLLQLIFKKEQVLIFDILGIWNSPSWFWCKNVTYFVNLVDILKVKKNLLIETVIK